MQTVSHIQGMQTAVLLIYKKSGFKAGIFFFFFAIYQQITSKRHNLMTKQVIVRHCANRAMSVPYNSASIICHPKFIPVNSFSKFSWHFYEFYTLSAHQCVYIQFPHLYWF